MRGSIFAAFVVGFVAGMAVLAGALWFTGSLRLPQTVNASRPLAAPVDTSMPNLSAAPKQPPMTSPSRLPEEARQAKPPAPPNAAGEAERSIPEASADHPMIPHAGVAAGQLEDTFHDVRDGHQHGALDIPAARGTPVLAAVEGNVAKLFTSKQGGLTVYQFDDSQKYCYYYAHLDRYATGLKEGTLLRKGQVLGYVGTTGDAPPNAPHLHFAVFRLGPEKSWWKGTPVDPLPLLR